MRYASSHFYQIYIDELPTTYIAPRQIRLGLSLTFFGLVFFSPTLALLFNIIMGNFVLAMLPLFVFTIVGTLLVLSGLLALTGKTQITFTLDQIDFNLKALFGSKSWSEPLQNYQGVRCWSQRRSSGRNTTSYTLYKIELHHSDKSKCLLLYQSTSQVGLLDIQADYCKLFNLPALNDYGIGSVVRPQEDVGKSVVELAHEGKLTNQVVFTDHLAPGMERVDSGEVLIELPKIKPSVGFVIVWALFSLVFFLIWRFDRPGTIMVAVFSIFFALVPICYIAWLALTREVIRINDERIKLSYKTRWGEIAGFEIALNRIESIQIGHPENARPLGILLITNERPQMIGQGLPEYELDKLKDRILTIIIRQKKVSEVTIFENRSSR